MMSKIVNDLLLRSCCHLFPKPGIQQYQILNPDPFLPRAREAKPLRREKLGNPRGILIGDGLRNPG
jgi:hypothetical protein